MATDAYDDTGAWYLAPLAQYDFLDKSRIANNHAGFQVGLGYDFAPHMAAELAVSNGSFRIPSLGTHEHLTAVAIDGLYKFLPVTALVRPFVLVGTGGMTDSVGPHAPNNDGWMAEAGGGALMALGSQAGSTRFQLRAEVKYRREFIQNVEFIPNNPGDIIAGIGFQWMFGAKTPPPPPVTRELPPPPAAEPPPPPPPPPEPCHAPAGFQVDANCKIIEQKLVVRAVDFEFNSLRLTAPARDTLDEVSAALMKQPEMQVEIQGYTDSIGTDAYNLGLSQKRADAVKEYLVSKGLSSSTLTAKGYGKADPIASNSTKEGRAQNRRVAFAVTNAPAHVKVVTKDATEESTEAAEKTDPNAVKPKQ
jgi:outer membrane protein OmpA-like peptidoglycan-associated protein